MSQCRTTWLRPGIYAGAVVALQVVCRPIAIWGDEAVQQVAKSSNPIEKLIDNGVLGIIVAVLAGWVVAMWRDKGATAAEHRAELLKQSNENETKLVALAVEHQKVVDKLTSEIKQLTETRVADLKAVLEKVDVMSSVWNRNLLDLARTLDKQSDFVRGVPESMEKQRDLLRDFRDEMREELRAHRKGDE